MRPVIRSFSLLNCKGWVPLVLLIIQILLIKKKLEYEIIIDLLNMIHEFNELKIKFVNLNKLNFELSI
jgi:hypothetical protein